MSKGKGNSYTIVYLLPCFFLLLLCGCQIPVKREGTTHLIFLGFGVVSLKNSPSDVDVVRSYCAGLSASSTAPVRISAGLSSTLTTRVPENATNVLIEARLQPFSGIKIEKPPQKP